VWFAYQLDAPGVMGGKPGRLPTVTVGPDRLQAHHQELHHWEDGYVIEPSGFLPKEVPK
jgi:hypothetical protein